MFALACMTAAPSLVAIALTVVGMTRSGRGAAARRESLLFVKLH